MTRPEPLPDVWFSRDLLVLREVARRVEAGDDDLSATAIAETLGLESKTVEDAGVRLEEGGYLAGGDSAWGHGILRFSRVTEKGRREVGQWPSPEVAADRLLAALQSAIDQAPEGPEKTKRQKALDAVVGMGRGIVVGVATNVLTGQIPT